MVACRSGYHAFWHHLRELGGGAARTSATPRATAPTGGHAQSIAALQDDIGGTKLASVDSTFFAALPAEQKVNLKVVRQIGPFPAPPVCVSSRSSVCTFEQLQEALLTASKQAHVHALMQQVGIARFEPVEWQTYAPLHNITRAETELAQKE